MRGKKPFLLLALFVPLSILAKANNDKENRKGDPVISGFVTDADSKKPVQGVTVSISSKGQDKKEFTTDATGNFKVPLMASGEVTIVLEKKGYKTFRKEGILVREGVTLKLSLDIEELDDDGGIFHPLLRIMDGF